jgi:hypothetical protein
MAMKAWEIYGEVDLRGEEKVKKGVKNTAAEAKKGETRFAKLGKSVLGAFAAYASVDKAIDFMHDAIFAASDLSESVSKSNAVFDESADKVQEWARTAAVSIGQSEQQALEATGTFGNLLVALGLNTDQAADMSIEMVKLASDLASFNNVSIEEALDAIRSGLTGETEPLKRFGVALNDARLKAVALDEGLIESATGVLPANVKAMAAYKLILEDTTVAQGDFSRTADGMANQLKTNAALWEDFKASVGGALEQPINDVLSKANAYLAAHEAGVAETDLAWYQMLFTLGHAGAVMDNVIETIENGERVMDRQRRATTEMTVAEERLAMRLAETEDQYDETREATRRLTEVTIEAQSATAEAEDAELRMINTQIRAEEKQKALSEAIAQYGEDSREARIAQLELNGALREADTAAAEYKVEADEAAEANERVANSQATIDAIAEVAAQWRGAAKRANAYRSAAQKALSLKPRTGGTYAGIQREEGGRTVGPAGGYPVTMHGVEWVIPERRDTNSLALWREVGRRIGAFEDAGRGTAAGPGGIVSTSSDIIIIADPRYTDMDKVNRDARKMQRGAIGTGSLMGRMGMGVERGL